MKADLRLGLNGWGLKQRQQLVVDVAQRVIVV
jgi:hypothetical protein